MSRTLIDKSGEVDLGNRNCGFGSATGEDGGDQGVLDSFVTGAVSRRDRPRFVGRIGGRSIGEVEKNRDSR